MRGVVVCATVCRARDAWFDIRRLSDNYIMCSDLLFGQASDVDLSLVRLVNFSSCIFRQLKHKQIIFNEETDCLVAK